MHKSELRFLNKTINNLTLTRHHIFIHVGHYSIINVSDCCIMPIKLVQKRSSRFTNILLTLKDALNASQAYAEAAVLLAVVAVLGKAGEGPSHELEALLCVLGALLVDQEDHHWRAWSQMVQQHLHKKSTKKT